MLQGKVMSEKICVLVAIFMLLLTRLAFGEILDKGFELHQTARVSTTDGDDNVYSSRIAGFVKGRCLVTEKIVKFTLFYEYQHELQNDTWWRKEVGAEIGASFFDQIFYYGASFQHVWQQPEAYEVESLEETTEWESRFVITPPINWGIFKDKVKLRVFDEYTYDFTRAQGTMNQVGAQIVWQFKESIKIPLGWRHIDRIHDFDSDTLEASVIFSF